ncbi:hypothetical protein ACFXK0_16675 [Nocardia sp. NPDC059177]
MGFPHDARNSGWNALFGTGFPRHAEAARPGAAPPTAEFGP